MVDYMMYLIHFKNLCKCHNVPLPITIIKEKNKEDLRVTKSGCDYQLIFSCFLFFLAFQLPDISQSSFSFIWSGF
jgi:hypothetical protein